jgi:hypothetical protein
MHLQGAKVFLPALFGEFSAFGHANHVLFSYGCDNRENHNLLFEG